MVAITVKLGLKYLGKHETLTHFRFNVGPAPWMVNQLDNNGSTSLATMGQSAWADPGGGGGGCVRARYYFLPNPLKGPKLAWIYQKSQGQAPKITGAPLPDDPCDPW